MQKKLLSQLEQTDGNKDALPYPSNAGRMKQITDTAAMGLLPYAVLIFAVDL